MPTHRTDGAQTVARAAALFDLYASERRPLSLSETAAALGLGKSTTHRLLATLRDCGYVRQDRASGRYALGAKVLLLAETYKTHHDLTSAARAVMMRVLTELDETVALVVREGDARYCIERLASPRDTRQLEPLGKRIPLGQGAAGRVLAMSDDEARRAGVLVTRGERMRDTCSIAAGIFGEEGHLLAALHVSAALDRIDDAKIAVCVERVAGAAGEISASLR